MAITFVNNGTLTTYGTKKTFTPTLPTSRYNGNILIALLCNQVGDGAAITVAGTGWTLGDHFYIGAWAWYIVDGSEAAPTFNWTNNSNGNGQIYQYSGVYGASPIGATSHAGTNTRYFIPNQITTQRANSSAVCLSLVSTNYALGAISPYTHDYTGTTQTTGTENIYREDEGAAGTTCSAINVDMTTAKIWCGLMFELCTQAASASFQAAWAFKPTRII